MLFIPWQYIKDNIFLTKISPKKLAKILTSYGLETETVNYKKGIYLKFNPLPNRSDLFFWQGIMKEVGALLGFRIKPINSLVKNKIKNKLVDVTIVTLDCYEFHLGLIRNVKIKRSPLWLKKWLEINGVSSVDSITDITNLVKLESGNLVYIFDYNALSDKKKIIVRSAQGGESFSINQNQIFTLSSSDVVISSEEKNTHLAGATKFKDPVLVSGAKNILIACANFNPKIIEATTKRLNLSTVNSYFLYQEANFLFSSKQTLYQVIFFINKISKRNLESELVFTYFRKKLKKKIIIIDQNYIEKKIGQKISAKIIEEIWQRMNFSVQKKRNVYHVAIPPYRPDVIIAEDLLEELLRIYDYNKIISSLL